MMPLANQITEQESSLSPGAVLEAHRRIAPYIHRTPLLMSHLLNEWLGHEIIFKAEGLQKIGAFKIRGALNALLALKEQHRLPREVVAFSSGNHAQAVALAAQMLGIKATIIMPKFVSKVKQQATRGYGAGIILTDTRQETEALAMERKKQGAYVLHPSDDDMVIAGQGTACLEALQDGVTPDAIFATCGGGGLLSGAHLATQLFAPDVLGLSPPSPIGGGQGGGMAGNALPHHAPHLASPLRGEEMDSPCTTRYSNILVFGAEPRLGNDAMLSYRTGRIESLADTPMTIADGARTLRVSERTFYYLKQLAGFYDAAERDIIYWTQWLSHLLKVSVEPTSAVAMAAAAEWLKTKDSRQRVLVILSGGNVDGGTERQIWEKDYLGEPPLYSQII